MKVITPRLLYNGALADAATALYTVPASAYVLIKSIVVLEVGGAARSVTLYVEQNGDVGYLLNGEVLPASGRMISETPLTLEAGAVIYGAADTADVVTCLISGAEMT